MVTIPSFSTPRTRAEFDNTRIFLTKFYQTNLGLSLNDASRIASQIITFKSQGLTGSQISKNLEQDSAFRVEKQLERDQKLEALKQTEKIKLRQQKIDEARRRSAERKKRRTSKERTAQEVRDLLNKRKSEPLVADPRNPRGALIPKSQADAIRLQLIKQGKSTRQTSLSQKNDPSIIDKIRQRLAFQKDDSKASVVAVNRGFVLLSNGKLVTRSSFKGVIPERFLSKQEPKSVSFTAKDSQGNIIQLKQFGTLNTIQSPIKTDNTASITQDLSKTSISTTRKPDSVFKPDESPEVTLGTVLEDISDSISNVFNPDSTTETTKQSEPIDPVKNITDFFSNFFSSINPPPAIIPSATAQEPESTVQPTPEPTPKSVEPTPKETPESTVDSKLGKVKNFVEKNGFAIAGLSLSLISLMAFLSVPREVRDEITRRD